MPRRVKDPFGYKTPPKPEALPSLRRTDLEHALCQAISKRVRVELTYEDDAAPRLFEPHAVYWSGKEKVCVSGVQITSSPEPRNLEVGKITNLRLTEQQFGAYPRFDRFDRKYEHGIICSI